jgi:hypothetical protein
LDQPVFQGEYARLELTWAFQVTGLEGRGKGEDPIRKIGFRESPCPLKSI